MQNSLWKLAALVGVVGIGFLVVLQAQRGLPPPDSSEVSTDPTDRPAVDHARATEDPAALGEGEPASLAAGSSPEPELTPAPRPPRSGRPAANGNGGSLDDAPGGPAQAAGDDGGDPFGAFEAAPQRSRDEQRPRPGAMAIPPADGEPIDDDAFPGSGPAGTRSGLVLAANQRVVDDGDVPGFPEAFGGPEAAEIEEDDRGPDGFADRKPGGAASARAERTGRLPGDDGLPRDPGGPFGTELEGLDALEEDDDFPPRTAPPRPADSRPVIADDPFSEPDDLEDSSHFDPESDEPDLGLPSLNGPSFGAPGAPPGLAESDGPSNVRILDRDAVPAPDAPEEDREDEDGPFGAESHAPAVPADAPQELDPSLEAAELLPPEAPAPAPLDDFPPGDAIIDRDAPHGSLQPQLKIEKVAPENAVLGQPLVYQIIVRNTGQSAAHQVVVEDRIPRGTKLTGTIPRAEMVEKTLLWRLGSVEAGEEKKISVRVVPVEEGEIGSIATVNFVAEVAARTFITAPSLELELTGPAQVSLGSRVTFQFTVSNTGSGEATGVFVRNIIPDGLKHPAGNDLEYEVGALAAGASRSVELTLTAVQAGELVNRAIVTADGGIAVEAEAELHVAGERLSIVRTGPKERFLGRPAVFSNTVTNVSESLVTQATVVEAVPGGMDFVEATAGGQYDPVRKSVTWRLDRLEPGQSRVLDVTLLPRRPGRLASTVTVEAAGGARAEITSETTVEGVAALGLEVPPLDDPVDVGAEVPIRVVARNRGSRPATNVRVTVTVPGEMEFVSASGPTHETRVGRQVVFAPLAAIEAGQQAEFDVLLTARQAGDARLQVRIEADEMQKPLTREEPVYIYGAP